MIIGFIDNDDDRQAVYDQIDYYFVIIYLVEFGMKIIGLGIMGYFRDNWNKLDFVLIVVTLSTDFAFSMFKVLRNARTVKATRIARINKTYRLIRVLRSFRVADLDSVFQILEKDCCISSSTPDQRQELHPHDHPVLEPDLPNGHHSRDRLPHLRAVRNDLLQRRVGSPQRGVQVQLL